MRVVAGYLHARLKLRCEIKIIVIVQRDGFCGSCEIFINGSVDRRDGNTTAIHNNKSKQYMVILDRLLLKTEDALQNAIFRIITNNTSLYR